MGAFGAQGEFSGQVYTGRGAGKGFDPGRFMVAVRNNPSRGRDILELADSKYSRHRPSGCPGRKWRQPADVHGAGLGSRVWPGLQTGPHSHSESSRQRVPKCAAGAETLRRPSSERAVFRSTSGKTSALNKGALNETRTFQSRKRPGPDTV